MKTEDKVCSLVQAKKLKELGVNLKYTERVFAVTIYSSKHILVRKSESAWGSIEWKEKKKALPAPDVSELELLIPYHIKGASIYMGKMKTGEYWLSMTTGMSTIEMICKTEAQARCSVLIWLLENDYLDVKELTKKCQESGQRRKL